MRRADDPGSRRSLTNQRQGRHGRANPPTAAPTARRRSRAPARERRASRGTHRRIRSRAPAQNWRRWRAVRRVRANAAVRSCTCCRGSWVVSEPADDCSTTCCWLDPFEVAAGHRPACAATRFDAGRARRDADEHAEAEALSRDRRLRRATAPLRLATRPARLAAALLARVDREGLRRDAGRPQPGGVVARQALVEGGDRIRRIVQLGAPNHGSYAAVLAMRGVHPTVRKLAALDLRHDAEDLSRLVFRTLPSLYRLLPTGPATGDVDFRSGGWPDDRLRPDPDSWPPLKRGAAPGRARIHVACASSDSASAPCRVA